MVKNNLFDIWVRVIVFLYNFERHKDSLKDNYDLRRFKGSSFVCICDVSKVLDLTYSHLNMVVSKILVPYGLVNVDSVGRSCIVSLTEKGLIESERLNEVFKDLGLKG